MENSGRAFVLANHELTRKNTNAVERLNSKNILASGREPHYCWTMTENRIEIDPNVMMGKPIIRGTRIAVELILRKLSEGATETDLLDGYPRLTHEDIQAAMRYAADALAHEEIGVVS